MDKTLKQVQIGNRYMKRCSTGLPISDMQIKTTTIGAPGWLSWLNI